MAQTDRDPISGNEVPAGALPEEVRDDQKIMGSEGEYVVPADVLRFYGLKFFENLRTKAKDKLTEMDAEGQIGGEPVDPKTEASQAMEEELTDEDIEELVRQTDEIVKMHKGGKVGRGFAEGGVITDAPAFDPSDYSILGLEDFGVSLDNQEGKEEPKTEVRNYVNSEGKILPVTFVNGEPTTDIPDGYEPQGSTKAKNRNDDEAGEVNRIDQESRKYGGLNGKNPLEMSREELLEAAENAKTGYERADAFSALGAIHPVAGVIPAAIKGNSVSNLNRLARVAEARGDQGLADQLRGELEDLSGGGFISNFIADNFANGSRRFERDLAALGGEVLPFDAPSPTTDPLGSTSMSSRGSAAPSRSLTDTSSYSGSGGVSGYQSTPSAGYSRGTAVTSSNTPSTRSLESTVTAGDTSKSASQAVSEAKSTRSSESLGFGDSVGSYDSGVNRDSSTSLSFRKGGLIKRRNR